MRVFLRMKNSICTCDSAGVSVCGNLLLKIGVEDFCERVDLQGTFVYVYLCC